MKTKEQLISSLNSPDESERLFAVEDILDSGLLELSIELANRLKIEESSVVKTSIVPVLQRMEYTPVYPTLFELFPHEDAFLRNSAVSIFAAYGENAVVFLSSYLDHSDREVRKLILDSLVEIAINRPETKNSVVDILRACLHDPAVNVVITATEYLAKLGDTSGFDDMIQLYKRVDEPMLRSTILDFFLAIGEKEDFKKVLASLFENTESVDTLFIPQVMRLLARSGKKDEFLQLVRGLQRHIFFSEDILVSLHWLVKNENLNPGECLDILQEIARKENLKEDLKLTCVALMLASQKEEALKFVKEWGKEGSKEFQDFCNESIGVENVR